jgi:hypothetical protein
MEKRRKNASIDDFAATWDYGLVNSRSVRAPVITLHARFFITASQSLLSFDMAQSHREQFRSTDRRCAGRSQGESGRIECNEKTLGS